MKREELKAGDWILANVNPGFGQPKHVALKVDFMGAFCLNTAGSIAMLINYDNVKPVPLTPEILEKNGWEEDIDKYGYTYYQHNGWYRLSRSEQEGSWAFSHYDDFLTTIQSVHELQHLLWALGIDDDLKI